MSSAKSTVRILGFQSLKVTALPDFGTMHSKEFLVRFLYIQQGPSIGWHTVECAEDLNVPLLIGPVHKLGSGYKVT